MGILDYMRTKKVEHKYAKDISEAENMFLSQKGAITSIKDSSGLKEIVQYWERQKEANENMFESSKDKDKYFALYKQSKEFLNFIANLLD